MGETLLLQGIYPFKLPDVPEDKTTILNYGKPLKDQKWIRPGVPANWGSMNKRQKEKWIDDEIERSFVTGVWIYLNKFGESTLFWLPPAYYWTLQWWWSKTGYLDFRENQLLEEYFELFCEADPWCIGTFRFKKRRDGLTTRRMARTIWKAIQTKDGWFGVQSKTGNDAKKVCWAILMRGFRKLPTFFLPDMSGTTDPKTILELKKPSTRITKSNTKEIFESDIFREEEDDDLNTSVDWRDTTSDAYDGQQLDEVTIDEFAKWMKASALDAVYTYIQSCSLDGVKVGMIHCITSPSEKDGRGHKDSLSMWESGDYLKIKDEPAFKLYRWFTSALDSYAEAINEYGFCDRDLARKLILAARNSAPESKKKAVIRQTPMYIDEIIDSVDNNIFTTSADINKRRRWLEKVLFKDPEQKNPKYVFGNFDWKNGIPDTEVFFRPSENQQDFSWTGRFCMAHTPTPGTNSTVLIQKVVQGKTKILAPSAAEYVLGVDPYDFKRVATAKPSNGASCMGKCFDFYEKGGLDQLAMIYDYRPKDPNVFYEDQIKAAVYFGALVNTEARNPKIIDYFETRGYFDWLLPKDMSKKGDKNLKGSATTNTMIEEICTLIEAYTTNALNEIWFEFLCQDLTDFDPDNTQSYNKTMAFGHMLLGFAKRRRFHKMKPLATPIMREQASALSDLYF